MARCTCKSVLLMEQNDATDRTEVRCAFFLQRKRRNCRLSATKGSIYCAEHLLQTSENKDAIDGDTNACGYKRILCPLDSSHTVYEHMLQKHLKKCNASKKTVPECFVQNINTGLIDYFPTAEEQLMLGDFDPSVIDNLIKRVEKAYYDIYEEIEQAFCSHPVLEKEIKDAVNGPAACKHLVQQSSIIGHLSQLHLLCSNTCYIEFGAGRGALSHWIQRSASKNDSVHYVLIDKASCRRKMDLKHRYDDQQGPKFERLLIDIEHLDISKLGCLSQRSFERVVAVSKHLCGGATDLTLRCLTNNLYSNKTVGGGSMLVSSPNLESMPVNKKLCDNSAVELPSPQCIPLPSCSDKPRVEGILIALCCHQRCEWKSFFGRDVMSSLGFSPLDFHLVTLMTSWAVCGVRPAVVQKSVVESFDRQEVLAQTTSDKSTEEECCLAESDHTTVAVSKSSCECEHSLIRHGGYCPHPKEGIGLKCKRLLDFCRVKQLKQLGYNVRLVYYTQKDVSLENVLLIGTTS